MGFFDWLFGKKNRSTDEDDEDRPARPAQKVATSKVAWKAGDRVLAKWEPDSYFYVGEIRTVSGKNCHVLFDDGYAAWVHAAHIFKPDIAIGSQVFGRLRGGPNYLPAIVREKKGEKVRLHYDHGEEEWTTLSFIRVRRPIADVGAEDPQQANFAGQIPKPTIDLGDPVEDGDWLVGDRVLGRWLDFFWYPGTILALGSKGFHILFDDGDQRVVVRQQLMPLTVEEGEQVFIRPKSEPQKVYQPAQVLRVNGETLDVELEDGTRETNTRVTRARFWRCPVRVPNFAFEEGDRVLALDGDNCTYPAEIVSISDDRVIVQYLDGPERMLTPELIRRFDLKPGVKVQCRWKGGPQYFAGTLHKVEGERVYIKYDDGDEEWNSVRLVRIPGPTF